MPRFLVCALPVLLAACQSAPQEKIAAAGTVDGGFVCPVRVPEATVRELCRSKRAYLFDYDPVLVQSRLDLMGGSGKVEEAGRPTAVTLDSFSEALRLGALLQESNAVGDPDCGGFRMAEQRACGTVPCDKGVVDLTSARRGSPTWLEGLSLTGSAGRFLAALDRGAPRVACSAHSNRVVCDILEQIDDFDASGRFRVAPPIPHLDLIPQHSILATLPGRGGTGSILIGAHLDSWSDSPGVEDNLSGVVSVLTMMRAIVDLELEFYGDLLFVFYAGEEGGHLGSCDIRRRFEGDGRMESLRAVLNFDMVGRASDPNVIYVAEPFNEGFQWQALSVAEIATRHFAEADLKVAPFPGSPKSDNVTWATACKPVASFRQMSKDESGNDWKHKPRDTRTDVESIDRVSRLALAVLWDID